MKIHFYQTANGRKIVEDFIQALPNKDRGKVLAIFKSIELYGFQALQLQFRQIESKLWEIKIRASDGSYRFFYVALSREEIVIVHAYKKQSQKAPTREIETAKKRIKEVLE